jgi:hypothetical protein
MSDMKFTVELSYIETHSFIGEIEAESQEKAKAMVRRYLSKHSFKSEIEKQFNGEWTKDASNVTIDDIYEEGVLL